MSRITALTKLERNRDATKGIIDYLEQELADHALTPLSQDQTNHLYGMAKCAQTDVVAIHRQIAELNPADIIAHEAEFQILLKRMTRLIGAYVGIKNKFPNPQTASSTSSSSTATPQDMRLPKLALPTFNGNLQQWVSFRDLFTNVIDSKTTISKSEKFMHLKSLVQGDAARLIQTLVVTDANYDIAWAKLIDRYQNERELVSSIFNRFLLQPNIASNKATQLRELIDTSLECVRSLEIFSLTLDKGLDAFLMFLLFWKLDPLTKQLWEQTLKDTKIPTFTSLIEFMEQRARALSSSVSTQSTQPHQSSQKQEPNRQQGHKVKTFHTQSTNCTCCNASDPHPLYKCPGFLSQSIATRVETLKKSGNCFNCFKTGHSVTNCSSQQRCRTCSGKHHTLIHRAKPQNQSTPTEKQPTSQTHHVTATESQVTPRFDTLLATAVIQVTDQHGQPQPCRVFLDSGSNTHFVTESCVKRLGIPQVKFPVETTGLGGESVASSTHCTTVSVTSRFDNSKSFPTQALIVKKISHELPIYKYDHSKYPHLQNLELADPLWFKPQRIDMLLGADIFFTILKNGKKTGPSDSPIAINSDFGWLIGGGSNLLKSTPRVVYQTSSRESEDDPKLDQLLERLWELEETPNTKILTLEEEACELHFKANYTRNEEGKFIVKLPFKSPRPVLGSSFDIAKRRLHSIERRLQQQPNYRQDYNNFMKEYESLGHMVEVPQNPDGDCSTTTCYIPHHFVLKASSTTTKFRVVFDASSKTSNGVSLNDCLMVGPTIQDSLTNILIRFRLHRIAFTADIAKMYRQVLVSPEHQNFQLILWRDDPSLPIRILKLCTVTYGTATGSFLATRSLQENAELEKETYPIASEITNRDFYVDDLMSGAPTIKEALECQTQLLELSDKAGFPLRKWSSNSQELLDALDPELRETQSVLSIDTDATIKALGILWDPKSDNFVFKIDSPIQQQMTKRKLLSEIAKLFDPIGWLAPVIITAKILMQSLWKIKSGWDDQLSPSIQQQWIDLQSDLFCLESLKISRCFFTDKIPTPNLNSSSPLRSLQNSQYCLVGFCDASEKAYAGAVYICAYSGDNFSSSLITSKTRVAPTKQVSLPRLELCGALLLAELMTTVKSALNLPFISITAWTDSTVTLAWIQSHPSRWKTFVANRVTKIQNAVSPEFWGHVRGEDNPADCASRGISSESLINHSLWWHGPSWLQNGIPIPGFHPTDPGNLNLCEEEERISPKTFATVSKPDLSLMSRFSSLKTLLRVTAYILRIPYNMRSKIVPSNSSISVTEEQQKRLVEDSRVGQPSRGGCGLENDKSTSASRTPRPDPLTPAEISRAQSRLIQLTQQQYFPNELKLLSNKRDIPRESPLLSLAPFIDENGLLRVGGRLRNAKITPDKKHPILLPRHSILTKLIIDSTHIEHCHSGPQLTAAAINQQFWIIRGKEAIRYQLKKCVRCTRFAAKLQQQFMGDLPQSRVNPSRPFSKCGVDYAGPFQLKRAPRCKITIKSYLAIFVCFVTRAIHIEVVSAATADAFLAALKRFVSRRGRPSDMFSDNGKNFEGANNEMSEWKQMIGADSVKDSVTHHMTNLGIHWHFIPPAAPHFGGLWEAGVKSVKFHLKRIVGSKSLTFEELNTITTQIEACLNSRPLIPSSNDPSDLTALSPGHFLIGAPLTALPEPNLTDENPTHLVRWQLMQQMTQHFWNRWSSEYLTRLQQRPKWTNSSRSIQEEDLVIIKDERHSPQTWKMGRVIAMHPGKDGHTRVVTLRTAKGELKRPIHKLCLLPIDKSNDTL